jgi:uncharacterized protein
VSSSRIARCGLLALVLAGIGACAPGERAQELRIGTASLGGAYYPLGQGLANLVSEHAAGLSMVPIVTRGAVDNPRLVVAGDVDIGITNADIAYFAYHGLPPYSEALPIAAAGALHPSVLHLVALEGSGIESFETLRGKRVAVGPVGGPTALLTEKLLAAYGMSMADIVPSFLAYSDGFSQLGDGNVDAAFALAGYPAAAVVQERATHRLRLISVQTQRVQPLLESNPYYRLVEVPKSVYDLDSDASALAVDNLLIVRADESPELVFAVVSAIYGNLQELAQSNAAARSIDPTQSEKLSIPLHPAALEYFSQP